MNLLQKLSGFVGLKPADFVARYGQMKIEEMLDLWGYPDFGQTEWEADFLQANRDRSVCDIFCAEVENPQEDTQEFVVDLEKLMEEKPRKRGRRKKAEAVEDSEDDSNDETVQNLT